MVSSIVRVDTIELIRPDQVGSDQTRLQQSRERWFSLPFIIKIAKTWQKRLLLWAIVQNWLRFSDQLKSSLSVVFVVCIFFTLSWRPWKLMGPFAIVIEVAHESFLGGDVFLSEHAVLALDCKEVFWASRVLDCKDVAWLYFRASNMLIHYSNIKFMYLLYTLDEHHTIYIIYYIYKWLGSGGGGVWPLKST